MQYLIVTLIALTAMGLPAQDALNAQLRNAVKSPLLSACISYGVGGVVLGALALTGVLGRGKVSDLAQTPWWVWAVGDCSGRRQSWPR